MCEVVQGLQESGRNKGDENVFFSGKGKLETGLWEDLRHHEVDMIEN